MRRFLIGCSAAVLSLAGAAIASPTSVQATTPPPAEDHPIVGAWTITVDEFPDDPPSLLAFHADGTFQEFDTDGATGIGSWEATGPSSVNLKFLSVTPSDEDEANPIVIIRASGAVSEDGQTFTAEFTIEFMGEGAPAGEFGPGHVTGTRIGIEPMGTPAGSLEDLFAQFEEGTEPEGTEPMETSPATTTG